MSCPRCGVQQGKLKSRTFSDQAVAALIVWEELEKSLVDQPLCEACYDELREVLIDRSDDVIKMSITSDNQAS